MHEHRLKMMNDTTTSDVSPLFSEISWMIIFICETFFILTANSVAIFIFAKLRKTLKRTSYLLISLTAADLIVGVAMTLYIWESIAVMLGEDVSVDVGRTAVKMDILALTASIVSLASTSFERMFAILWPFRHRVLRKRYYFVSIGVIWIIAGLVTALKADFDLRQLREGKNYHWLPTAVILSSLCIIIAANVSIWIVTRKNRLAKNIRGNRTLTQNRKLVRTLLIITFLSLVTWLPLGISMIFPNFIRKFQSYTVQLIFAFNCGNSVLNPIVYCLRMAEFRLALKKVFCRWAHSTQGNDNIQLRGQNLHP